ncbi:MAG: hypothetical protein R3B49_08080 [Phycisphaerales bacterium]
MPNVVRVFLAALLASLVGLGAPARAQDILGTGFTYQGKLTDSGAAPTGLYDMSFQLETSLGDTVAAPVVVPSVPVTGGVFTVTLDFGAVFGPEAYFLHIAVRPSGSGGAYTDLSPAQAVVGVPAAQWAMGPWKTNLFTGELTYPFNIGIGVSDPAWPIDVSATQAVARLTTTTSTNGSVLELRNARASSTPAFLGAINFVDSDGGYRGQIGYTGADAMTFRVAGIERMRIASNGAVTLTPQDRWVSVNAAAFEATLNATSVARSGAGTFAVLYAAVNDELIAPLSLPDGCTIKEIRFAVAAANAPAKCRFVRQDLATLPNVPVTDGGSATVPPDGTFNPITVTLTVNELIDNSRYSYALVVAADPLDVYVGVFGARVRYTVTTPLP